MIQEYPFMNDILEEFTLSESDMFTSPKFARLKVLLPELIKEGHRILLFSQWTQCMDLIECLLGM